MKKVLTTCTYCGCGCNFYLQVRDGEVVGVYPSKKHPISQGILCVKGWNVHEFINHPARLKTPLVKKNGALVPVGWDEALSVVGEKLNTIRRQTGPDSLGFLSSAKCTNEENYLMMKLARAACGTNNVDHCARLCHASTVAGLALAFGSGAMTNSINEVEDCDVLLITGSNTTEQHPATGNRIIRAYDKGAKIIIADPREIPLAKYAALHMRQRPGTDIALFNGMMKVIVDENLLDKEYIEMRTEGFEEFRKVLARYPLEQVEKITNVPAADIKKAARLYASSKKASIIYSMGITQHTTGTDNVLTLANLVLLTGHVGFPHTGINPLRGQNNVQGACDMGALPNVLSGYQAWANEELRKKFEKAWAIEKLPDKMGLTVVEMINAAAKGELKALYIMGENPMLSDPNITHVEEGLRKLEFLVVQDIFLTETAQLADVVLPGTSFAEKDGTFTNTERRVQRIRKSVDPVGQSLPDWQILQKIAKLLGYKMDYGSPAKIMEEIASVTPIYGGIFYDRLEEFGLQWPCPKREHPGTKFLHREAFSRGKGKFSPIDHLPPAEETDREYPFTLTTGRMYFHFHTGTMTRKTSQLHREHPEGFVEVNPADAKELGIRSGCFVKVITRRGSINIRAQVSTIVPGKTIFIPFHFREAAANILTNDALDPKSKIPEFKVCAAKVEVSQ
ncbi:MAG: formate dehydrogenase subunit alpha [Candidatus Margulisbacteria bacterium]|nr:formate dehydrogenase subunit alpha [Candidatus Margulisiibacteriota bacterium]